MTTLEPALGRLLQYLIAQGLVAPSDADWARNRVLEVLHNPPYDLAAERQGPVTGETIDEILEPLLVAGLASGALAMDTATRRDLLDTAIMGAVLAPPSATAERFWRLHAADPVAATDDFYGFGIASNYIRKSRTDRNPAWRHPSRYGTLDMTVNLAKPEKDPRDIAAQADVRATGYPACLLCRENEGYPGTMSHPARQNLRLVPMELTAEPWFMQYSPYLYYPEHSIFLSAEHRPMAISRHGLERLVEIITLLPHYFVGSNADLPIVGGSILSHDHFQGGRYEFPLQRAAVRREFQASQSVAAVSLDWPLTTLRLTSADPAELVAVSDALIEAWREYSDPERGVLAATGGTPHNTVTPIARRVGAAFQFDLVLRNNRTSSRHPDGIFHPHAEIHPVKRENIGLIEVMGLAVLPGRLQQQMAGLARALVTGEPLAGELAAHEPMLAQIRADASGDWDDAAASAAVHAAVGDYFVTGLEHCGVFGTGAESDVALERFAVALGWAT